MNKNIIDNIPNKIKSQSQDLVKFNSKKKNNEESLKIQKGFNNNINNNPPKKIINEIFNINNNKKQIQSISHIINPIPKKTNQIRFQKEIITRKKLNLKPKTVNYYISQKINDINQEPSSNMNSKSLLKKIVKVAKNDSSLLGKINNSKENDNTFKNKEDLDLYKITSDKVIEIKEMNIIPFSQALRIDNRNYGQIFLSVIFSEIKIIRIFYYKSPYDHLSILFSKYIFELCLDLTFNCILYTEDVISEKYNNNGSIKFFTTLSLSFLSNIISSLIAFIVSKFAEYIELFEFIIKDVTDTSKYFSNMIRFKKILSFKLTVFFIIQTIINLLMCYYLMIFCTVYHKTQGSIMINYITGVAESMAISLCLSLITSLMRYLSTKYRWKSIYYTSKYFFEKF